MEWNDDMSAAPRDGTLILLYEPRGQSVGKWEDNRYLAKGGEWCVWFDDEELVYHVQYDQFEYLGIMPTHWMPLPKPPSDFATRTDTPQPDTVP